MRKIVGVFLVVAGLLTGPVLVAHAAESNQSIELRDSSAVKTYGDEADDFGVKPQDRLQDAAHIDGHTPTSIPGGKIVTTGELLKALGAPDRAPIVFDVLERNSPHKPLPGALVWTFANSPGTFKDKAQAYVKTVLDAVMGDDKSYPIVFYCGGANCWQGYNAALRAIHAGYGNVYWYRGGVRAWDLYEAEQAQSGGQSAE